MFGKNEISEIKKEKTKLLKKKLRVDKASLNFKGNFRIFSAFRPACVENGCIGGLSDFVELLNKAEKNGLGGW